jgi:hypothetical protein
MVGSVDVVPMTDTDILWLVHGVIFHHVTTMWQKFYAKLESILG